MPHDTPSVAMECRNKLETMINAFAPSMQFVIYYFFAVIMFIRNILTRTTPV